ncbi:MAG: MBOAT family protein [Gammaproteobacteria bacterium]|nr:MBOAT family protein [Gammaproteobacteria bacterium]NNK34025.1 MBOAT family protein [Xanthomonadales bacterium]
MVFSSSIFLFYFLPAFLICYTIFPARNAIILLFSALFYAWGEGVFLLVLVESVLVNFIAGRMIEQSSGRGRKAALAIGVAANLLVLFFFKYFGFFIYDVLGHASFDPAMVPHLPLGISFFTFQSISYLVDVYRREAPPARSVWELAVYIMMFPQLIAGPIVRYASVASQIRTRKVLPEQVAHGLMFFAVGLAQKVLVANNVAGVADRVFGLAGDELSALLAWTGALFYTLQIYFDFAGYSNMAIGIGLMLGFRFPKNFDYPYISQSITEFWRRWHMSLSSWFRDYLYIPLGGNRVSTATTYRNLLVVFVLCGLWHGASWTFLAWGLYHGALLVVERLGWGRQLSRLPVVARHFYALAAVVVGWVLFRSESFGQAGVMLGRMFGLANSTGMAPGFWELVDHQELAAAALGIVAATPVARKLVTRFVTDRDVEAPSGTFSGWSWQSARDAAFVLGLVFLCATYVVAGTYNPFIYFRF